MRLEQLYINNTGYNADTYCLRGTVKFVDDKRGDIQVHLRPEQLKSILTIVASALVESAQMLAQELTQEIIKEAANLPALEHILEPEATPVPSNLLNDGIPF